MDTLDLFLPPVRHWFRTALGEPTPAQRMGWPAIAEGKNTLILAPTGSGKTLAAFLACLDGLWRQPEPPRGVRVLYVSPLKALNNDIHRNLQVPLEGVAAAARELAIPLPRLTTAVRTGDTPAAERQRLVRHPPHVLITTPESLHLLLTSRARDTLRGVTHCIIDEIHSLCGNKRGVFLALLLERLAALNPAPFVRIGLSATQRPLDEVARYLGGADWTPAGELAPRPVTIIDAGIRRDLDLQVVNPVPAFGPLPEKTIWPSIYRLLADLVRSHRSTLIFANNRRTVERITAQLNENEDKVELARAHHGSVSLEARRDTETQLKEGRLPAVVSTASLEMGIDMGAVELVCQVESPGNIARALQRVGRAGHLFGQTSKGRLIPKTPADLLEQAVLAREMVHGRVEAVHVPPNCLDVLAQQVVALAAMDPWPVPELYALVRRAYPFRDLSPEAFEAVLEMVSGRYRFTPQDLARTSLAALQPRVSWDRAHNRLLPLPGSQKLALVSGGTIPDTGQYAAYTTAGVRIGELDEEFIYERRVGDVFLLGTNAWRVDRIDTDRVHVTPAEGQPALVPFWRGESAGRSTDLGQALGSFLRELEGRLADAGCTDWLQSECHLDAAAARSLRQFAQRQTLTAGGLPSDRTLYIESSRDQLGDWQVLLLSPLGSRLHLTLRLALEARLRQRLGYAPRCLHHDDGVLIHLSDTDEPVLDLLAGLTPENVEPMLLGELGDSALFAIRFRQNAARALLLPRGKPGRRAPLWLQRLRGRDLLQVARRYPDFPIVAETFRECLHDHLDLPALQKLLADIRDGHVTVKSRRAEAPSPFAASLLFSFTAAFMYQYDRTDADPDGGRALDTRLLEQLVSPERQSHLLDPRAVHQVDRRLRGLGRPPRSASELAEWLRRLGDLAPDELEGPMEMLIEELAADGRARRLELPRTRRPARWVLAELEPEYARAFGLSAASPDEQQAAAEAVLARFMQTHALVGLADVLDRYPFERAWAQRKLEEWASAGRLVSLPAETPEETVRWSAPGNLEQVQRGTLAMLRREVVPCSPDQFADFLLRWQGAHPDTRRGLPEGLAAALDRLEGLPLPAPIWEQTVLPARVPGYQPRWLDEAIAGGEWAWIGHGEGTDSLAVSFRRRESLPEWPAPAAMLAPSAEAEAVRESLRTRGASFVSDLAQATALPPAGIRSAVWQLARQGLVTNDRYDIVRRGDQDVVPPAPSPDARSAPGTRLLRSRPSLTGLRRQATLRPEGRWSLVPWGQPAPEEVALRQAGLLLHRYGVAARELAMLDPGLVPWRILYEVLSRLELAGEVRRGYFVEGLSGAQFALPEAARQLQELHLPSTAAAPVVLLHSLDPANLYGSGAPFDIPMLDGGTRPLLRRPGNWLVLRAGKPVLLAEGQGSRLTSLPSARRDDVAAAVACLPAILDAGRAGAGLGPAAKLSIETWNGQPVTTTEGKELLEAAGFVRDYQGMTLYAAWR